MTKTDPFLATGDNHDLMIRVKYVAPFLGKRLWILYSQSTFTTISNQWATIDARERQTLEKETVDDARILHTMLVI